MIIIQLILILYILLILLLFGPFGSRLFSEFPKLVICGPIISTYFIILQKPIELPQQYRAHLLPAYPFAFRIYQDPIALIRPQFEKADQARPGTWSYAGFSRNKEIINELIRIRPGEILRFQVKCINNRFMLFLTANFFEQIIFHSLKHKAYDIASRCMICLHLKTMRIGKFAAFQPELLYLSIHFIDKCLDVVFVAFVWEFECLLNHVVYISLAIGIVVYFAFLAEVWHV